MNLKNHLHSPTCGCKNEKGEVLFVTAPSAQTQKALDYCETHLKALNL